MTLKIQRSTDGPVVVFTLSGRVEGEHVAELQRLFASESEDRRLVLDLTEVDLVDREAVQFLARCETEGIQLENCPAYIREWMARESDRR